MTKEELERTNEQLVADYNRLNDKDNSRRKEFAKAFSWFKPRGPYAAEQEIATPSWEQIFVEIGKLLAVTNTWKLEQTVEGIQSHLINLEENSKSLDK